MHMVILNPLSNAYTLTHNSEPINRQRHRCGDGGKSAQPRTGQHYA